MIKLPTFDNLFPPLRAVARKKLQPRRTHGPLYEISRMKSSNIISLIKKIKIDSIWYNFTEASASVRLILATAVPLRRRVTRATTFSRQNDTDSRASTTKY